MTKILHIPSGEFLTFSTKTIDRSIIFEECLTYNCYFSAMHYLQYNYGFVSKDEAKYRLAEYEVIND